MYLFGCVGACGGGEGVRAGVPRACGSECVCECAWLRGCVAAWLRLMYWLLIRVFALQLYDLHGCQMSSSDGEYLLGRTAAEHLVLEAHSHKVIQLVHAWNSKVCVL